MYCFLPLETLEIMSLWKFLLTVTKHICRNEKSGKSQTQNVNHGIAYTDGRNANKEFN